MAGESSDRSVVAQLSFELGIDTDSLYKELTQFTNKADRQLTSSFANTGKNMGKKLLAGLGFGAAIYKLKDFVSSSIELGSNLTEVQNVVDTSFKTMSSAVNAFAKDAMYNFGLSETVAKKYMGTIGAMNNAFGFTEKASYDMAEAVTGLAGDVASFYNLESDEAFTKLKSIWTGETETLKDLGVIMTQTALDQYALNNGFGKTTAKMTEQEKVMLRFQYVTTALSDATGDFVKTQDTWANQTRVLSLRIESLKATMGQGFINLFTPILRGLNSILEKLSAVAEGFKLFTESITGTTAVTQGFANVATGAATAAGNVDNITTSLQEAKKELAGFDKISKIGDESSNISSGSSTPADTNIGDMGQASGEVSSMANSIADALEPLRKLIEDWKIGDFFSVGGDVSDLVIQINDFIAEAIASVNWENLGANVGAFLRGIKWLDVFKSLWEVLHSAIDGAVNFYFGMFEEAPFETAFITAIGLWKFTGISNAIVGKINDKLGTALSAEKFSFSSVLNMAFKVAVAYEVGGSIGYKLGSMLMTALDEDLADFYKEFSSLKEIGDYIFKFGFEDGIQETFDALGELTTELLDKLSGGSPAGELNEALGNAKGNAEKTKDIIFDTWNEIQKEGIEDIVIDLRVLTTEYGNINEAVEAYKKQMKAAGKSIDTDKIRHASKLLMTLYDGIEQYNNLSVEKITLNDILTDGKNSIKKSKENLNGLVKYTNRKIGTINPISISLSTFLAEKDSLSFIEQTNWLLEHDLDTAILDVDSFPAKWETMSYIEQTNWLLEHDIDTAVIDADKTPAENKLAALLAYSNVISQKFGNYKVTADTSPAIKSVTSGVSIMNAGLGLIKKPSINANTTPAINAVSTGVSVMNAGLSLIKSPTINLDTSNALDQAESLRGGIEAAFKGMRIMLQVAIQEKIKDTIASAINIGKAAKQGIGTITAFAAGGFPEDGLFFANHNELVGKFSNGNTAVANNEQILTGIENATAKGILGGLAAVNLRSSMAGPPPLAMTEKYNAGENEIKQMIQEVVAQSNAGSGYTKEMVIVLKELLQLIRELDLDIVIDGKKLKDIIVDRINEHTQQTGVCEIQI